MATLYGSDQQTRWQRGSDFISYRETSWDRNAQGFEKVEAFIAGQSQSQLSTSSLALESAPVVGNETVGNSAEMYGSGQVSVWSGNASDDAYRPQRAPVTVDATEQQHDLAAQLLVEALEMREEFASAPAANELGWHIDPTAERHLLDEIFSRFA